MVQIKQMLLSQSQKNVPNRTMKPKYITIHDTGNTDVGANALMHAKYQRNGSGGRQASWHYQVDDHEIWQSLLDTQQGWHAGDGSGSGNRESIGIETCINTDANFKETVKNVQWLVKHLMDKHGIPLSRVVTHKNWSGKNCPATLLGQWQTFKNGIGKSSTNVSKPIPQKPSTPTKTNSIVDYLKSVGMDSSFNNRQKLAKQYGISNYKGTANQNANLLNKLRTQKPSTGTSGSGSTGSSYKGNSIVDYLKSKGIDASYKNRQTLARQYGVSNYRGTASQNSDLLKRMQKGVTPKPKPKPKGNQKTNSIVDYLKSIKVNSSYANRKKLAKQYGVKNYRGTASQNNQLLRKMRG